MDESFHGANFWGGLSGELAKMAASQKPVYQYRCVLEMRGEP
jgi:hypothetical protein